MAIRINEVTGGNEITTKRVVEKENIEDFSFTLKKIDENGLKDRLESLLSDITTQGKKLSEHMDIRDMKEYRRLVTDFVNEIVNNSHQFSRENFLDRRGRHRVYGIVKLVNEDLDELAQELMKQEKNNLNVLEKVDEIRGLLLDITL